MTSEEGKEVLAELQKCCESICDIAKVAKRHGKSLGGHNPYGERFHAVVIALAKVRTKLGLVFEAADLDGDKRKELSKQLDLLEAPKLESRRRNEIAKAVRLISHAEVIPRIERLTASSVPATEQVLPLDLVRPTRRKYIEKIVIQANGCYEHRWFDACSVMIRRLVETLIIELYEAKGNESAIKHPTGEFFMLGRLVDSLLASKAWNLSREPRRLLPGIKLLGDRSAHSRRYLATKQDVDKVIPGLRVVAEELLHLAGLS
jgi:hypothetical protein